MGGRKAREQQARERLRRTASMAASPHPEYCSGQPRLVPSLLPMRLRCEYLINPLGINTRKPRLSWILESEVNGQRQTAYRITAADGKTAGADGGAEPRLHHTGAHGSRAHCAGDNARGTDQPSGPLQHGQRRHDLRARGWCYGMFQRYYRESLERCESEFLGGRSMT